MVAIQNTCGVADCDDWGQYAVGIADAPLNDEPRSLSEAEVQIFPNPASSTLHISTSSARWSGDFVLYDLLGKMVLQQHCSSTITQIPIDCLPSGIYLYQIIDSDKKTLQYGKVNVLR